MQSDRKAACGRLSVVCNTLFNGVLIMGNP